MVTALPLFDGTGQILRKLNGSAAHGDTVRRVLVLTGHGCDCLEGIHHIRVDFDSSAAVRRRTD
jgi:hypothetical protein